VGRCRCRPGRASAHRRDRSPVARRGSPPHRRPGCGPTRWCCRGRRRAPRPRGGPRRRGDRRGRSSARRPRWRCASGPRPGNGRTPGGVELTGPQVPFGVGGGVLGTEHQPAGPAPPPDDTEQPEPGRRHHLERRGRQGVARGGDPEPVGARRQVDRHLVAGAVAAEALAPDDAPAEVVLDRLPPAARAAFDAHEGRVHGAVATERATVPATRDRRQPLHLGAWSVDPTAAARAGADRCGHLRGRGPARRPTAAEPARERIGEIGVRVDERQHRPLAEHGVAALVVLLVVLLRGGEVAVVAVREPDHHGVPGAGRRLREDGGTQVAAGLHGGLAGDAEEERLADPQRLDLGGGGPDGGTGDDLASVHRVGQGGGTTLALESGLVEGARAVLGTAEERHAPERPVGDGLAGCGLLPLVAEGGRAPVDDQGAPRSSPATSQAARIPRAIRRPTRSDTACWL
jgi:hypothetical protein